MLLPGTPKSRPPDFCYFFNYYTELLNIFYTLVTNPITGESGKFHCIIYGIDKTALLLIAATWQF